MTDLTTPKSPMNTAQTILADMQALRQDMSTILELARSTALPLEGEKESVLATMVRLLHMIVNGLEVNRKAIEALHQRLDEPGIALALRRMIEAD